MAHVLIAGTTMSGKSTLARQLAAQYKRAGIGVIVLDPLQDDRWGADYQTADNGAFLASAKNSWQCALFVDEAGAAIGRYNPEMEWCVTQGRHLGHRTHVITQWPTQLSPLVRGQCAYLYLFQVPRKAAALLAEEFNSEQLEAAAALPMGECLEMQRGGAVRRHKVF